VPRSTGPLIPRRRFGGEIKRLRDARGETLADTARVLMISTSKLSRIETGQGELRPRDVRDLLAYFGIGDTPEGAQLQEWAEEARKPGWWQDGTYRMPQRLDTFIGYESAASRIEDYSPIVVPGWLQTAQYATETLRRLAPTLTPEQVTEQVELRMERQEALASRENPPELLLAVPEAVLHRAVGTRAVMRDQLDLLLACSNDPLIELRIIPFAAGLYPAMEGGFAIFHFADERDPDVVAVETVSSTQFIDAEDRVDKHRESMRDLHNYWLSRADSTEFIREFRIGLNEG
jgi:transcriptional regulator with XRE-family HTH domain